MFGQPLFSMLLLDPTQITYRLVRAGDLSWVVPVTQLGGVLSLVSHCSKRRSRTSTALVPYHKNGIELIGIGLVILY